MLRNIRTHLEVAESRNTQVGNYIDGGQVDARHGELAFEPIGKGLDCRAKRDRVSTELRVRADLPQMEEEG
jgi:hypothetical protein